MHPAETVYWILGGFAVIVAALGIYGILIAFGIWGVAESVLVYASARERYEAP